MNNKTYEVILFLNGENDPIHINQVKVDNKEDKSVIAKAISLIEDREIIYKLLAEDLRVSVAIVKINDDIKMYTISKLYKQYQSKQWIKKQYPKIAEYIGI